MQTSISDQIKAVQRARAGYYDGNKDESAILNDAASTLAAIKMLLSGDIGEDWEKYQYEVNPRGDKRNADVFTDFLKQRGLPINK